ncbi:MULTISPECIES: hypothetical protein [unclassified Sphingomonas]|uniref:hypothetical protein n=1 Tax=unclassified Sphingomonas TaxID=196159 RepID=UPI001910F8E8|nr:MULTISPECIES: hypothetical protein [unclassified Sphingomonas]
MSYDLLVFDPSVAPRERAAFMQWFEAQTDWSEGEGTVEALPEALRHWHQAMLPAWPDMQEVEDDRIDDPHVTGYSLGANVIYVDFRWSVANEAYETVRRLAIEHRVGFYDVSGDEGDGEIYFPGDEPNPPSGGAWRQIADQFKSLEDTPATPKASWLNIFRRTQ